MGLFGGPRAHLDEQKANACRKLIELAQREALAAHEVDEQIIEAFEADGLVFEYERNGIGGEKRIVEAEHREHAEGRAGRQVERGGDDVGAGAFRADQRARHVEAVLRKQLVQVVPGDAARNPRELFAHQRRVAVADAGEAGVDLAHAAAAADERVKLVRRCGADRHARAIVENDVERLHVVYGFAAHQPVDAATVVADDAAKRAPGMSGGIGRVGEVMHFGGVAQAVENDARLNTGEPGSRIDRRERVHVPRVVEDHGHVDALAGKAGTRAAR